MELKKPMKYSIILGLAGSVMIPLFYEAYANISKTFAMVLLFIWAAVCSWKLIRFPVKEGLLAISCMLAYTGVLGIVMYVIIHPAVRGFLEKNSKYYYLTIKEEVSFFGTAIGLMCLVYVAFFAKILLIKTVEKVNDNREKAGQYIDNAFDSSEDGGEI